MLNKVFRFSHKDSKNIDTRNKMARKRKAVLLSDLAVTPSKPRQAPTRYMPDDLMCITGQDWVWVTRIKTRDDVNAEAGSALQTCALCEPPPTQN